MQSFNPFFHLGRPVADPTYFYGRQQAVDSTEGTLLNGQGVSVIGPRKIGKTSFLVHVAHMLATEQYDPSSSYCCVYLNCQGRESPTALEFCLLLFEELERELTATHRQDALPALPTAPVFGDIRRALRVVTGRGIRIIFMLDEFEEVARNPHMDVEFFAGLRSLHEAGLREVGNITYVTASMRALTRLEYAHPEVLTEPPSSSFFNIFYSSAPLGFFSRAEAAALLLGTAAKGRVSFEPFLDALLDLVVEVAGYHPLLLQVAGHHAFAYVAEHGHLDDQGKEEVRAEVVRRARDRVWDHAWNKLSPHDQKCISLLAIKQPLDIETVSRLKETCLVVEREGKLDLISAEVRGFVADKTVDGLIQVPPLILDLQQRRVVIHAHELNPPLPPNEFRLLERLAREPEMVVSHQDLFEHVYPGEQWGNGFHGNRDRLKATLKELNDSLNEAATVAGKPRPQIESVRGEGYRLLPLPFR